MPCGPDQEGRFDAVLHEQRHIGSTLITGKLLQLNVTLR